MLRSLLLSCAVLVMTVGSQTAQAHDYYRTRADHPRIIYVDNDNHGHGNGHRRHHNETRYSNKHHGDERDFSDNRSIRFGTDDLNIIINWYNTQGRSSVTHDRNDLGLPPGLERQIRLRGDLPPGLRVRALPPGLERSLSPAPRDCQRVMIGDDVALISIATGAIIDMIRLAQ